MGFPRSGAFLSLLLITSALTSEERPTDNAYEFRAIPPVDPDKKELPNLCPTLFERLSDFFMGEFDSATKACLEGATGLGNISSENHENGTVDEMWPVGNDTSEAGGAHVEFDLYVALWPEARSIGWIVGPAITQYLDASLRRCDVAMDREDLARLPRRNQTEIDMILMSNRLNPTVHVKEKDRDWWHYTFKFDCYLTGTQIPVNQTTLEQLDRDVVASLLKAEAVKEEVLADIEALLNTTIPSAFDANLYPPNITNHETVDPDNGNTSSFPPKCVPKCCFDNQDSALPCKDIPACDQPCSDNATYLPSASPTGPAISPTFIESLETPLDIEAWTIRRYVGLGLLIMTVVGTFLLIQLAEIRRRHRIEQSNWGNLATEQGVDQLLRMGWKLDGSNMEVYDKRKIGYEDNDSMLVGGFQQTVLVGAEITVSQSETTRETP